MNSPNKYLQLKIVFFEFNVGIGIYLAHSGVP